MWQSCCSQQTRGVAPRCCRKSRAVVHSGSLCQTTPDVVPQATHITSHKRTNRTQARAHIVAQAHTHTHTHTRTHARAHTHTQHVSDCCVPPHTCTPAHSARTSATPLPASSPPYQASITACTRSVTSPSSSARANGPPLTMTTTMGVPGRGVKGHRPPTHKNQIQHKQHVVNIGPQNARMEKTAAHRFWQPHGSVLLAVQAA